MENWLHCHLFSTKIEYDFRGNALYVCICSIDMVYELGQSYTRPAIVIIDGLMYIFGCNDLTREIGRCTHLSEFTYAIQLKVLPKIMGR